MTRVVQLQRGFWTSIALLIAWIAIPTGIYSIVQGRIGPLAIIIIALGVLVIVLALSDSIAERLTSLRVELWRIAAFLVIFLYFGLSQAFVSAPSFSISPAEQAFFAVNRVVTVLTIAIVLWQLVRAVRNSSLSAQ